MATNGVEHGKSPSEVAVNGNNHTTAPAATGDGTDGSLEKRFDQMKTNNGEVDEMQNFTKPPSEWTSQEQQMARDIVRQVEYYFSDENLKGDIYLYGRMRGHKNLPVHVEKIHEFSKMTKFQPYSMVVDALRTSKVLKLETNPKTGQLGVVRRNPFIRGEHTVGHDVPKPRGEVKVRQRCKREGSSEEMRLMVACTLTSCRSDLQASKSSSPMPLSLHSKPLKKKISTTSPYLSRNVSRSPFNASSRGAASTLTWHTSGRCLSSLVASLPVRSNSQVA